MAATREARAVWNGDLISGSGIVAGISSGRLNDLPVSWSARTEAPGGKTSPEELLAAAHASCFAMALSAGLAKAGTPPKRLQGSPKVPFGKVGVRDRMRVDRRVRGDADVKRDRASIVAPVVDAVRSVDPEVADRYRPGFQHQVCAVEGALAVGDVPHDRSPARLHHERLARVLDDGSIESCLALRDWRARLTAHYAPVA